MEKIQLEALQSPKWASTFLPRQEVGNARRMVLQAGDLKVFGCPGTASRVPIGSNLIKGRKWTVASRMKVELISD